MKFFAKKTFNLLPTTVIWIVEYRALTKEMISFLQDKYIFKSFQRIIFSSEVPTWKS
jgi:hypothetical protein